MNKCSRSIINMGGQFQSTGTDLFSTAAAVRRRYGSAAGFTCVYLCSTIRVNMTTDSFNYFLSCILLGEVLSVVF